MELHPLTKVLIGVLGAGAVAAAVWLGRSGDALPVDGSTGDSTAATADKTAANDSNPLRISPTGPYPKAVCDDPTYKFEPMAAGGEGRHVFTIRNDGEAPLQLAQGKTTCKCTLSKVAKDEIPPGGTAEVELIWHVTGGSSLFRQTATIWTNDPEQEAIQLAVGGPVSELVEVNPTGSWSLASLVKDEPVTVSGFVYSRVLDDFDLKRAVESSSPVLTAEAVPMTPAELKSAQVKCGYRINATLQPDMPLGRFRERLTVRVDRAEVAAINILVEGERTGPLSFLPTPGTRWLRSAMAVDLGEFDADRGAKGTLLMFVSGLDEEELEFLSVDVDPKAVNVTLTPEPNAAGGTRKKYRLTFEVPPGSPPLTRGNDDPVRITIKTNHPQAAELKFRVRFISS